VVGPAAVEPVGHLPLRRGVLLDVGVEQQQRDAAHLGAPDLRAQHLVVRQAHRDLDRRAFPAVLAWLAQQCQRQAVGVDRRIALLLPAVRAQGLLEVAAPIEQPDADDRYAEVAGRLEVVAGEDPEAARVLRQHLRDPELRREVRDRCWYIGQRLIPAWLAQVVLQVVVRIGQPAQEPAVGGQGSKPVRIDFAEQSKRVMTDIRPRRRVDGFEQVERLGMP
jgi:hypothetical protein